MLRLGDDFLALLKSEIFEVKNISGQDLNDIRGNIPFAYGNNCINRPTGAGNGWFSSTPHPTDGNNYILQTWVERPSNRRWQRLRENGAWQPWEQK